MSDLDPLDENLLKEARFLIWLLLQLMPSPFERGPCARLDEAVWAELIDDPQSELMPDGTFERAFGFGQFSNKTGAGVPMRWLCVTFKHNPSTGRVEDVEHTLNIEPEDQFWWLMWFTSYLKGPRDILA